MDYREFLGYEHPIVCLPMNRLSDINLAIAVAKSGCLPSLVISAYTNDWGKIFYADRLKQDLARFLKETGTCNVLLSMTDFFLTHHHEEITNLITTFKVSHVEIIPYYGNSDIETSYSVETYIQYLVKLKQHGVKIVVKCLAIPVEQVSAVLIENGVIDAIIVKTSKGAGKVSRAYHDVVDLTIKTKLLYPSTNVIVCGGITNSVQIKNALAAGATAVGLGTIFAMSKESKMCIENKVKLVFKKSKDIESMRKSGMLGQNAIVFEKYEDWDNENNSRSLERGIRGEGGHVFMGHGIEQINEILSVSEIVNRLTKINV